MNPSFKPCWVFCHMQANFNSNLQNVYQKLNTTSNTHFNFYLVVIHLCERQRERFPHPQILYPKMTCDSVSEPGWSWGWELDLDLPYGPHGSSCLNYFLLSPSWYFSKKLRSRAEVEPEPRHSNMRSKCLRCLARGLPWHPSSLKYSLSCLLFSWAMNCHFSLNSYNSFYT